MIKPMDTPRRLILAERLRHPPKVDEGAVLISIKPRYADLIARGEKRVEFRRRFPARLAAARAFFYVTSPVQAIALRAQIAAVRRDTPAELWKAFGDASGASRREFDAYFTDAAKGVALLLERVKVLEFPVGLNDPRLRALAFRPPQSLEVLPADSPLLELLSSWAGPGRAPDRRAW